MLTDRERAMLQHICDGLTYARIGKIFGIGEKAVGTALGVIQNKFGVESHEECVVIAIKFGIATCERKANFSEFGSLPLLITQGKSNQEISGVLEISEGSVKQKTHRMFKKPGVQNRCQLTALYTASHQ